VKLQKAGDLDPRSPRTAASIRARYAEAGRYDEALRYAEGVVSLSADQPAPYVDKAWLHLLMGDTAAAHQTVQLGGERVGLVTMLFTIARHDWGPVLFRGFDDYGEVVRGMSQDAFGADTGDYLLAKAGAYYATPNLARPYFDSSAAWALAAHQTNTESLIYRAILAQAYAGIGRDEAALEQIEALRGIAPGPYSYHLVDAFLMLGEHDAAVEHLGGMMSNPHLLSPAVLRFDPFWDPLRDHPGFQELLEGGD
jgi:tetratricopeptide (TPR) repeat protein